MKEPGKIAFGISGIVVVALVLALAAPKRVHAVVSAFVTVANTSANPVPTTDVMRSVAQNVELQCDPRGAPSCFLLSPTGLNVNPTQYIVPPGSNLVITDVEIFAPQGGGTTTLLLFSTIPGNPPRTENWAVAGDGATHQFEFPSGIVILPGATLTCASGEPPTAVSLAIIRGYLTAN